MTDLPPLYRWLHRETGPRVLMEAIALYGEREIPGAKHNSKIIAWAKALGRKAGLSIRNDETPWCGTFVGYCVQQAGFIPPDIAVRAKSWLLWGMPQPVAMLGDVLVFNRIGGGHVGLYIGHDDTCYHVLGGNQGNTVSIVRIEKYRCAGIRRCPWRTNQPENVRPVRLGASGAISQNEA